MHKQTSMITIFIPILLIVVGLLTTHFLSATTLYLSPTLTNKENAAHIFKTSKPVILWDIHEVLFEPHIFLNIKNALVTAPHKLILFKQFLKCVLRIKTWKTIYKEGLALNKVKQAYFSVFADYPELYARYIHFSNCIYQPNEKVFDIVRALRAQGYEQYIFSNIGPDVFNDLKRRYPEHFALFSSPNNVINQTNAQPGNWIWKPQAQAYSLALSHLTVPAHNIIFVDDQKKNIKGAQKAGMTGIIFKNEVQLKKDFLSMGIE